MQPHQWRVSPECFLVPSAPQQEPLGRSPLLILGAQKPHHPDPLGGCCQGSQGTWLAATGYSPSTQEGAARVVPATCPGKQEHFTVCERSSILFLLQHL